MAFSSPVLLLSHECTLNWSSPVDAYSHLPNIPTDSYCGRSMNTPSALQVQKRFVSFDHHPWIFFFSGALTRCALLVGQVVESILVIDFDEEGKIARMVDQRRGLDPPTKWGAQQLRRLNGRVTPWVPWLGSHPKSRPNSH
jgi:hypothetical protein